MRALYLALSLLFTAAALPAQAANAGDLSHIGESAPPFELQDVNGKLRSLSEFKGNVVLLNFWATWCSSCKTELDPLNNLYRALKKDGFVVLAVSLDRSEKPVRTLLAGKNIAFPVVMDKDKEVAFDQYAVLALPVSILIDRNGVIAERLIGERQWDSPEMEQKVRTLLNRRQ
jgi:peroxiredoxin